MFKKILTILLRCCQQEGFICRTLDEDQLTVHLALKQLEMIKYVRQIDQGDDPLWAITIIGKGGMGTHTLDMKDSAPQQPVDLKTLMILVKSAETMHDGLIHQMKKSTPEKPDVTIKLATRRTEMEPSTKDESQAPKSMKERAREASEKRTARNAKPVKSSKPGKP